MSATKFPSVVCAEETCRAEFVYLENPEKGTIVPVDVSSLSPEEVSEIKLTGRTVGVVFDGARHVSHFKTCTNPRRFSRTKGGKDAKA